MMILSAKNFTPFLVLLITLCLPVPPSHAEDCGCSLLEKSIREAEGLFRDIRDSRETDPGALFMQCRDQVGFPPGLLYPYCVDLVTAKKESRLQEIRDREIKKIKDLLAGCKEAAGKCAAWKTTLAEECASLKGDQRLRCYLEKNLWQEYRGRFFKDAQDFLKKMKNDRDNVKNFLYAKKNVCDRKYIDNPPRRERCLANFKKKYHVTDILDRIFSSGEGAAPAAGKEPIRNSRHQGKKDGGHALDSLIEGRWSSQEAGCILEFRKTNDAFYIKCIIGCGKEERFAWQKGLNFTRKYSRSNRLGSGSFNETCVFDQKVKEFRCDGLVRYRTKFGKENFIRLETRHYKKMLQ